MMKRENKLSSETQKHVQSPRRSNSPKIFLSPNMRDVLAHNTFTALWALTSIKQINPLQRFSGLFCPKIYIWDSYCSRNCEMLDPVNHSTRKLFMPKAIVYYSSLINVS